ncbi:hypothetical protein [Streptomyces sp. TLI_171]|uniref:hypothetical protein n=1 Tax=Streptomyces sp. TLI_171 TaxID=1938859 RepID=UPI001C7D2A4D|nr:hypothetical protein [Streptomyces sp. TLI_171]
MLGRSRAGGKLRIWERELDRLALRGDERTWTSALGLYNIPSPAGRFRALDEAVRVLRPGGRLLIADIGVMVGVGAGGGQAGRVAPVRPPPRP